MAQVFPPFPIYTDTDGSPLEDGFIYYGVANQNAQTNPIAIYWDAGLTIPAANPVRTINGYASNNGSPGNIFVSGDFSIIVRDKNQELVYSRLTNIETTSSDDMGPLWLASVSGVDAITATSSVGLTQYTDGLTLQFESVGTNTGPVTLSVDGLNVVNVTKDGATALVAGDIPSGALVSVVFIDSGFQLLSQKPNEYATQSVFANNLKIANTKYVDRASAFKNFSVGASVNANALTVTLDPCYIDFRSATASSGTLTRIEVPAAISLVLPNGASLGATNNAPVRIAILAINNGGVAELAVANAFGGVSFDESFTVNTTAISVGSTSQSIIYSTSTLSGVPFKVVGFVDTTQVTAGTYATSPSVVQGIGSNEVWQTRLTLGVPTATTTGTSYDFTGIPIWAKKVFIAITGSTSNGTNAIFRLQLGTSAGIDSTGNYVYSEFANAGPAAFSTTSTFFPISAQLGTGVALYSQVELLRSIDSSITWNIKGQGLSTVAATSHLVCGAKSLSSALDRVRVTVSTGNFTAGSIRVFWE